MLHEADSAQAAAERLVNEAVERGGADNATAVVVRRRCNDETQNRLSVTASSAARLASAR